MTSFRPTVNPAKFKLRNRRRIADFFRRVVEPAGARSRVVPGAVRRVPRDRVSFSVISRLTYLRDFFAALSFDILIARTFFMILRRVALSALDNPAMPNKIRQYMICQLIFS